MADWNRWAISTVSVRKINPIVAVFLIIKNELVKSRDEIPSGAIAVKIASLKVGEAAAMKQRKNFPIVSVSIWCA